MDIGVMVLAAVVALWGPEQAERPFNQQYKDKAVAASVESLESLDSPLFRYRVHIVNLMQLKPGMAAAQIGAGSGFVARLMAERVGPEGRVRATESDPKMVAYMTDRANAEGIANLAAIAGQPSATGLEPASMDVIAFVGRLSTYARPAEILASSADTLKPKGLLLVVDTPREGQGATMTGIDAEEVITLAAAAGFDRVDENGTVPGHYSLRFRKR
jgi:ubiquinone/menaquinone biosynthesis C-methylase UbiE